MTMIAQPAQQALQPSMQLMLLRPPSNHAMLFLLIKFNALVHVLGLLCSARHRQSQWREPCTKHKGGGIQSLVASGPHPRWSSPVSFPLSATLLASMAADKAIQGKVRTKIAS